jgi:DNA-binding response OmpR family regulator
MALTKDAASECRVAGRVLVAEDEFVIALEVEDVLRRAGYEVVGPAATPEDAARLATEEPLDAAVLDVELRGGRVFPAAEALARRGVPFVFLTGYEPVMLPANLRGRPLLAKPFATARLPAALAAAVREQRVRERAHALWEQEGRPAGAADRHWLAAEAELRAEAERGQR